MTTIVIGNVILNAGKVTYPQGCSLRVSFKWLCLCLCHYLSVGNSCLLVNHTWLNVSEVTVTSMGMKLKPSKCRSFSLLSGSPSVVPFHIDGSPVASIRDEEQKFLGKLLFFKGKSEETFSYIRDIFQEGIDNIDKAMVRNEYKLWMYINYLLPSKRFLLTIHTITDTHLKLLDTLIPDICHRRHGRCPCNFFLAGVNFSRCNAKDWPFYCMIWDTLYNITQCVQCNTVYNLVHCV